MFRRLTILLGIVVASAACRPGETLRAPRAPQTSAERAPEAVDAGATIAPPESRGGRWVVSAQEAQTHGLAPFGFSLAEVPRSMIPTRFPASGTLAVFSGPPGGPLGVIVEADALSAGDPVALREALTTAPGLHIGSPRTLGAPEQVSFGGAMRPAVPLLAGVSLARTHYCVVIVAPPEGLSRGLLVWLYVSGADAAAPDCARVLSHPALRPLAAGFRPSGAVDAPERNR